MSNSSSDKPVFRSRCTVTHSDIANYGSFLSTSLSISEASRIGWYRSMARKYTPRPPTHLPRVNRVLFADDALNYLPTPGDCVDTTCWTGKFGGTRSFTILGEAFYQGRLLCLFESLRVLVATTDEQSQYIKELHIERKTQKTFQAVDMDAYLDDDANTAINSMDLYTGHSEVDALSHLNMAFYPKFVANVIPPGMVLGKPKRLDVDYISEIPLAATVNVTMRRGKEPNVVFFLTKNAKGKLVNRVRFAFDPKKLTPTKPQIPRHVVNPLVVLVRYEHSCSSGCFAQWTLENVDLALTTLASKNDQSFFVHGLDELVTRSDTSEIKVEFQYVPIMGEIFVGKTSPVRSSSDSILEVEFCDAYSHGRVMKGTVTSNSMNKNDANKSNNIRSGDWIKIGRYAPQFRSQYMSFEGKFRLPILMAMIDDAHHILVQKDSIHLSDFMARLENLQPDSWMESYTIQCLNMKLLNEWNYSGQLKIEVFRSETERSYQFDFIWCDLATTTTNNDNVLACRISTMDIRDSNIMLKSSKSFAFKDESFRQMQHEIEGVIEPRYARL